MNCPVCGAKRLQTLLELDNWPLFQHPVADAESITPVHCELRYVFCPECGHALQERDHQALLEQVYRLHYYTPADPSLGRSFRRLFLDFVREKVPELRAGSLRVLEIGCAFGAMLGDLQREFPGHRYAGFEPNTENAARAREITPNIVPEFFTTASVGSHGSRYDVVFSRHVVEHVFDLDDFFAAIEHVTKGDALLLLETPSLDRCVETASIDPFHVEHVHVFSMSSLARLCARHGWHLAASRTTPAGNMMARFERGGRGGWRPEPPKDVDAGAIGARLRRWREAVERTAAGRDIVVWGAGSFGLCAHSLLGVRPALFIDGNANKEGLRYVGLDVPIRHAPAVIREMIEKGEQEKYIVVIASAYFAEIKSELRALGWRGARLALPEVA